MANFKETRTPYEFLVRWNNEGQIQGAHVGWLDTLLKDGIIISQIPSNVESVGDNGFPLDEILSKIQIDALAQLVLVNAEKTALAEQNTALQSELDFIKSAKTSEVNV